MKAYRRGYTDALEKFAAKVPRNFDTDMGRLINGAIIGAIPGGIIGAISGSEEEGNRFRRALLGAGIGAGLGGLGYMYGGRRSDDIFEDAVMANREAWLRKMKEMGFEIDPADMRD